MHSRSSTFRIIERLILLLFAISPFITVINAVAFKAGWIKDFICILICLLVLMNRAISFNKSYLGILVYFVFVCMGLLITEELSIAAKFDLFRYRVEYMITFLLLFSCYRLSSEETLELGRKALKVIYISSGIVALVGLIEFINPSLVHSIYGNNLTVHISLFLGGERTNRLMSTMANPINLGLQMGIGTVTAFYFFYQQDSKRSRNKLAIAASILLFLFIAFLTYSRTAYVSILSIIASFFLINLLSGKKKLKRYIPIIVLIGVIAIGIYLIGSRYSSITHRINSVNLDSYTNNTRFNRASNVFGDIINNPFKLIFGSGVGAIVGGSGQYVFELGFASLVYESGIINLVIFLVYIIRSIKFAISNTKKNNNNSVLTVVLASFNVGFFIAMFAEAVYAQYPYTLFFWFCIILSEKIRLGSYPIAKKN